MKSKNTQGLGFWAVSAIGVGGMVGGGIFAVLGLAVQLAHGATPVAFLIAGIVAMVTAYSYIRFSVAFPSQGGTVEFVNQAFGEGVFTGSLNVLLWISYIVMLSLYAFAFGSYAGSFFSGSLEPIVRHIAITAAIIVMTVLNVAGSKLVGEAEEIVVGFKLAILFAFIVFGLPGADFASLSRASWPAIPQLVAGGMIIFLAYEGFELIANSAGDVRSPEKTLPRAFLASVLFVILLYMLISAVAVGNLSVDQIVSAKDYALAVAARPFLGAAGFSLIAVAAMLSTGSAINATLYGSARVSYIIAKEGELPHALEQKIWKRPLEGLLITAGISVVVANLFQLSSISVMGSAGFLMVFAAVNVAALKLRKRIGARAFLPLLGAILCVGALAALIWQRVSTAPEDIWIFISMVGLSLVVETLYRLRSGRSIRPQHKNQ